MGATPSVVLFSLFGFDPNATLLLWVAISVVLLIFLIAACKLHAFLALTLASLVMGLCSGMKPIDVARSFQEGVGNVLGSIAVVIGLGTILGKLLAESKGAEIIATKLRH